MKPSRMWKRQNSPRHLLKRSWSGLSRDSAAKSTASSMHASGGGDVGGGSSKKNIVNHNNEDAAWTVVSGGGNHAMNSMETSTKSMGDASLKPSSFSSSRGPVSDGKLGTKNRAPESEDLDVFVKDLISNMEHRFAQVSDGILGKIDNMGERMDDLEKSISELMDQAGVEAQPAPQVVAMGLDGDRSSVDATDDNSGRPLSENNATAAASSSSLGHRGGAGTGSATGEAPAGALTVGGLSTIPASPTPAAHQPGVEAAAP